MPHLIFSAAGRSTALSRQSQNRSAKPCTWWQVRLLPQRHHLQSNGLDQTISIAKKSNLNVSLLLFLIRLVAFIRHSKQIKAMGKQTQITSAFQSPFKPTPLSRAKQPHDSPKKLGESTQASDSSQQAPKATVLFQSQNPEVLSPRDLSTWPLPKNIFLCEKGKKKRQPGWGEERRGSCGWRAEGNSSHTGSRGKGTTN